MIKRTSKAIEANTRDLRERFYSRTFEWYLDKGIKYAVDVQNTFDPHNLYRVHLRMNDLIDCLIECKKNLHAHSGLISSEYLDRLAAIPDAELTQEKIVTLIREIDVKCKSDLEQTFETYITKVTAYSTQIQVAGFNVNAVSNSDRLIQDIHTIKNFLSGVKSNQLSEIF